MLIDFDDDPPGTADLAWFRSLSGSKVINGRRVILIQTENGRHRLASWAERVIPALDRLIDVRCDDLETPSGHSSDFGLSPHQVVILSMTPGYLAGKDEKAF